MINIKIFPKKITGGVYASEGFGSFSRDENGNIIPSTLPIKPISKELFYKLLHKKSKTESK